MGKVNMYCSCGESMLTLCQDGEENAIQANWLKVHSPAPEHQQTTADGANFAAAQPQRVSLGEPEPESDGEASS